MTNSSLPVLSIRDLTVDFAVGERNVHAVREMNLDVCRGEMVAIVGESGSGKSTAMLAVMGLLSANASVSGQALLDGTDLLQVSPATLRRIRGSRLAMIFQDPMTSLNPVLTVGQQLCEAVLVHRSISKSAAADRACELLELVAIPNPQVRLRSYPHELSGGMRQRVMIAMALANDPEVLIADEPTTALDVTIQAQILEVLNNVRRSRDFSIVLVTHDLGVVAGVADSVHVMYGGTLAKRPRV